MHSIQFWKSWYKPNRILFQVLAGVFLLSIGYLWYTYYQTPAPVITWEYYQQFSSEDIPVRSFQVGLFSIPVLGENHVIYENILGSQLQPNLDAYYIFLAVFIIAFVILLSVITTLRRFWFFVGMGLLCLFIILLKTETLLVLGIANKIPASVILVLLGALAYYFHSFNASAGFFIRIAAFAGLTLIIGLVMVFTSQVTHPLLHIAVNCLPFGILLSVIFILMVAHEIPASFITALTRSNRQSKSLQHFLIISAIYLVNLFLAYALKIGAINWNLWVVNFFLLFTVSAILGIWGFRHREAQYENIMSSDPLGVYFFVALGMVAFSVIAYFLATANDTIINVFNDFIIYSHLGYGIIFIAYVLSNFGSMLSQNLQVHKVLYKPATMPYFTFRLMGLICSVVFLMYDSNWKTPLNEMYASYFNSYGDIYYAEGDDETAETFYNKSLFYRNQNHHAHYALACIQEARLEPTNERRELSQICEYSPSEFAFINLSNTYQRTESNLESLLVLNEGKVKFPNSGIINNALGLAYSRLGMGDSAIFSFQKARNSSITKEKAETNLLAASSRHNASYPADSLLLLLGSDKEGPRTNALALANLQRLPIDIPFEPGADTTLSATKAAFISNYLLNQPGKLDTATIGKLLTLARRPSNENFKEYLVLSVAHAYYAHGQITKAFDLVRTLAFGTGRGKYFNLIGTWALEQDNPQVAANYFALAQESSQPRSLLFEAIALTEADSLSKALEVWDSLSRTTDSATVRLARKTASTLRMSSSRVSAMDDDSKYLYCRYKISLTDSTSFWQIVSGIQNEELRAMAIYDYSKAWFAIDEPGIALQLLSKAEDLTITHTGNQNRIVLLHLMILAESNPELLKQTLPERQSLKTVYINEMRYLESVVNPSANPATFNYLAKANVNFEEGLVASAKVFAADSSDPLKAYSLLMEGLLAKPHSVKLLKAHIRQALLLDFGNEAQESLTTLHKLIPAASFNRFTATLHQGQ